jgi:hypothetical protein
VIVEPSAQQRPLSRITALDLLDADLEFLDDDCG